MIFNLNLKLPGALSDFIALVYPETCAACEAPLQQRERVMCTSCAYFLPFTGHHLVNGNPVERLFWGRIHLERAAACFSFQKAGHVQNLVHQLKYKGRREAGLEIGRLYGLMLKAAPGFLETDLIIPVPLHPSRLKQRGYNQSECFGRGLSENMGIPVQTDILIRGSAAGSQTRRSRFSRWQNVESEFILKEPEKVQGKHLLLVDDVVTTGATVEACVRTLQSQGEVRVSLATIAAALI